MQGDFTVAVVWRAHKVQVDIVGIGIEVASARFKVEVVVVAYLLPVLPNQAWGFRIRVEAEEVEVGRKDILINKLWHIQSIDCIRQR